MNRKTQVNIWYVFLAIFGVFVLRDMWVESRTIEPIPYSQFQTYLDNGKIEKVVVGKETINGTFKKPQDGKTGFVTTTVPPDIAARLASHKVTFTGRVENTWLSTLLSWVLPALIFVGIWIFFIRKFAEKQGMGGMGGFMSIGKSKAKIYVESDTRTTFKDVAGVDEAKEELEEIVEFLKAPDKYGGLGARMPKGVLLVGPPGTGKTLLARAVAGEASVPFYSISGSEFVEMFVGVGAARVRDLFEQARKAAPAIIFVDELDALGRSRSAGQQMGGHDEREQTLNQLLTELDGFDPTEGVVLLAATNRPEILDPALLRAGRFDRQVLVDRPDRVGRVQILGVHMNKIKAAEDIDPDQIAALTTGFSGADLANLVNEAALMATRRKAKTVEMKDFTQAVERIVAGLEKRNRRLNDREREIVAHHEMGHAIVGMALPGVDVVHKVSIIPRGVGALGYTISRPTEDRFLMTREELENKIAVLLGGRVAEKIIYGHLSTGAADDLARATDIARSMVAHYGMDPDLGHVSYDNGRQNFLGQTDPASMLNRHYSDATAERMDHAVKDVMDTIFKRTLALLEKNRAVLESAAAELLKRETLEDVELKKIAAAVQRPEEAA